MKKTILLLTSLLIVFTVFSQERFELFYIAGNYNFMKTSADDTEKNGETAFSAQVKIPIVFKNKDVWYSQIDYQYFDVDNEYLTNSPFERLQLHGIILKTGYIHRLNESSSIQALISPRLMTDFNVSFADALQWGGILMYEKIKSETLTWKVGVMYNQDLFGPYVVPVVDLNWKLTDKLRLSGLIPVYAALYGEFSENTEAGIHFIGLTTSYRISEPGFENSYVDRRSIDLSLFAKQHLFNNFFLTARVGYSVTRDFGIFDVNDKMDIGFPLVNVGDDRIRLNNEYDGSPFVHVRLTYAVPMK